MKELMEFTNATRQDSRLENGSHEIVLHGQVHDYLMKNRYVFVPHMLKPSVFSMFINQFINFRTKMAKETGVSVSFLSDPSASPYYNVTSTTRPQHRLAFNSSIMNPCDLLERPLQCFYPDASHVLGKFNNHYKVSTNFVYKFISLFNLEQGESISFYSQTDYYDICATQFSKSKCGRGWRLETTMTRVMTRELEHLIGGVIPRYKGVRWRPERKHPWVAEIKIFEKKTKKKMWIGNFDTPEEAARAYDVAVIQYQKQRTLNFKASCKLIPDSTMRSIMTRDQNPTIGSSVEIPTSQSMCLDTDTSLGEANVQAKATPTCALVNQDCKMHPPIMHVDFQPHSTNIMTLEKYPTLEGDDQEHEEVNPNNRTFRVLENESKLYFMFASDLPSMIDTHNLLERTDSSSKHRVDDMHFHELCTLGTEEVEDVESVEMNTNFIRSLPSIEGTK